MPDPLNLPIRANLADLFVRGSELILKDGDVETRLWLQKLNPIERQTAARKSNAARAKFMSARYDKESEEYLDVLLYVESLDKPDLIEPLLAGERGKIYRLQAAKLEQEPPWKDGHINGLRDAWNGGLEKVYEENPKDPEAKRVRTQLYKFRDEMTAASDDEIEGLRAALEEKSDAELKEDLIDTLFKGLANGVGEAEFVRCQIWLGTRWADDHAAAVFKDRDAVDALQEETIAKLSEGFVLLEVGLEEGKDSEEVQTSSL